MSWRLHCTLFIRLIDNRHSKHVKKHSRVCSHAVWVATHNSPCNTYEQSKCNRNLQHHPAHILQNATSTSIHAGSSECRFVCRVSRSAMLRPSCATLTTKHRPVVSKHVRNAISQLLIASCWFERLMSCCKLHAHRIDENTQCLNGPDQVDHIIWLAITHIRKVQPLCQRLATDLVCMENSMNPAWQDSLRDFLCAVEMVRGGSLAAIASYYQVLVKQRM